MRVLLVAAAGSTAGGGERHVADLLATLPARGFDVALVAPVAGELGDRARAAGVPAFPAPIDTGPAPAGLAALRHALAWFSPDVVHAHGARAAAFARVADRRARRRVVYTLHGIHVDQAGSSARRAGFLSVERLLRPRTARFVCVCRSDAVKGARLGVLDLQRTAVVYNGIRPVQPAAAGSFRREIGAQPGAPLVLSVGRLHEQKDQATLVAAFGLVRRSRPDTLLAIIGAGALEEQVRGLVTAEGLDGGVRLLAPRPELGPAYADADVFALSSRWEGLPYVVLEAMAHGLPVVATDVDGVPEAVRDGVSGILVPTGDPEALASGLLKVVEAPELGRRLGAAGRGYVTRRFTLEAMVDGLCSVYRGVARDQERSAGRPT